MPDKQTKGREKNGATPEGKPNPATSDSDVKRVGEQSRTKAGPDGPDAGEIGETFKR